MWQPVAVYGAVATPEEAAFSAPAYPYRYDGCDAEVSPPTAVRPAHGIPAYPSYPSYLYKNFLYAGAAHAWFPVLWVCVYAVRARTVRAIGYDVCRVCRARARGSGAPSHNTPHRGYNSR